MIGGWELIVVLFLVLLLFGGKKLPDLARNLGKGMREFKKASQGILDEEKEGGEEEPDNKDVNKK
ncbi:MAG: Sec-independent protein translocase protein TatA [Chlamydiae bacterium]|nr:Sec-independent protein translocase protein TatA [Chlamydiota bacterium]